MSELEPIKPILPTELEVAENTSQELTGQPVFDLQVFLERQGIIDGIMSKEYSSDDNRVEDLNTHFAGWDDEHGISFTYMVGRTLPGIKIHIPATAIAFAANYAPAADFEGANLDYALMSASVMPDVNLSHSSLDHALLPVAKISGSALGASAVKSVMNFADVTNLDMRGVDVGVAYLLGTQGIDAEKLTSFADVQEAISELAASQQDPEVNALLGDNLSRFAGGDAIKDIIGRLRHPQVFSRVNAAEVILRKQLRDRRQGVVLNEVIMSGSEVSKFDFEGSIWHKVIADRIHAGATRLAGAIVMRSSLDNADSRGVYAPGLVAMQSSFRGTPLPKNSAGAVYFDCDLTGSSVDEVEEGGTVIIGGRPPIIESSLPHIRTLQYSEVPPPVLDNLQKHAMTKIQPKSIELTTPELEA